MSELGTYAHLRTQPEVLAQAEADFRGADVDHDGFLGEYEFLSFYEHLERHLDAQKHRRERALTAFLRFDADNSGFIEKAREVKGQPTLQTLVSLIARN